MRPQRLRERAWVAWAVVLVVGIVGARGVQGGNVSWTFTDNISGCPAGDSVVVGHPARLRIAVTYLDGSGLPRNGVPPESIYVLAEALVPNAKFNDETIDTLVLPGNLKAYADDSTRSGQTRITLPSISGNGICRLRLWVSGVLDLLDTRDINVRSTDSDPFVTDGRVTPTDTLTVGDLNYDGVINQADRDLVKPHLDHWHRNPLHGTLVRRTSLCGTCPGGSPNTMGAGDISWSAGGGRVAFSSRREESADCVIRLVPSDPAGGDAMTQFSYPPVDKEDYDPSWSPLGTEIVYDRSDKEIYRKGVAGLNPDTSEVLVYSAGTQTATQGSVSPDGGKVVFARTSPTDYVNIWVVPITGGPATQITTDVNVKAPLTIP